MNHRENQCSEHEEQVLESVPCRPLPDINRTFFYFHNGNKNVSDLVDADSAAIAAHYDYAPFGAVTTATGSFAAINPYRFSSEWHDDQLDCVYYNYRHYNPMDGRWQNRDPIGNFGFLSSQQKLVSSSVRNFSKAYFWLIQKERRLPDEILNSYHYCRNQTVNSLDDLGLGSEWYRHGHCCNKSSGDEWALVAQGEECGKWKKLAPGECVGSYWSDEDCEGMTCGGGFYKVGWEHAGSCSTPGCDSWPYTQRRYGSGEAGSDVHTPQGLRACKNAGNKPPGYEYKPRKDPKCCS